MIELNSPKRIYLCRLFLLLSIYLSEGYQLPFLPASIVPGTHMVQSLSREGYNESVFPWWMNCAFTRVVLIKSRPPSRQSAKLPWQRRMRCHITSHRRSDQYNRSYNRESHPYYVGRISSPQGWGQPLMLQ